MSTEKLVEKLEDRISRIRSYTLNLRRENTALRNQIETKDKLIDQLRTQIDIAAKELEAQILRLKNWKDNHSI